MTDRDIIISAVIIAVSTISFFISGLVSIGRTNLGIEQGSAATVAFICFAVAAVTLIRLGWKCEKDKEC